MWWHHDLAWWGVVLSIIALVLMLPVNLLANVLTPLLKNWFSTWSRTSLENRIGKLEKQLAELEKYAPIDEVQNQILWGIRVIRIGVIQMGSLVGIMIYFATKAVSNQDSPAFKEFTFFIFFILIANIVLTLVVRYKKDFRYKRSPQVRKSLRKSLDELKTIRANWHGSEA
jgi:hypothetical protein